MEISIIGAGLAGCIAGVIFQNSRIYEAGPNKTGHQALLRFRTPDIGEAVGIPFEKVKVYKGIWHNDKPVELSPRYINLYSRKVSDKIAVRSIVHQETVERWIAPRDFHEMLKDQIGDRIVYNHPIQEGDMAFIGRPAISTMPIHLLARLLDDNTVEMHNNINKIYVSKYRIPDCNIHMTYYYTDPTVNVYRASITGNELIMESMFEIDDNDYNVVKRSFGLTGMILTELLCNFEQPNGKLTPIDEVSRRQFIYNATVNHGIYSLGRFAVWKNLVLDDVYKDLLVIKSLMNKDKYEHNRRLEK